MEWVRKKLEKVVNNLILKVPVGTQVFEEDNNTLIEDLTKSRSKNYYSKRR